MLKDINEMDLKIDNRNTNNTSPTTESIKNSIFRFLIFKNIKGWETKPKTTENIRKQR